MLAVKISPDGSTTADLAAIRQALEWVVDHVATCHIAAVNLSFAAGCVDKGDGAVALEDLYEELATLGVFVSAAAGNAYGPLAAQGISELAASLYVAAVGSVWDSDAGPATWRSGAADYTTAPDRVASFSQRGEGLDLLAPGADILNTRLGGGLVTKSGTSTAAPMVAAAAVLVREAADRAGVSLTPAEIRSILQRSAVAVTDGDDENDNVPNTGRTYERLNLKAAIDLALATKYRPPEVGTEILSPGVPRLRRLQQIGRAHV